MAELEFNEVNTAEKFSSFLRELSIALRANPDVYENQTSESLLDAAAAWVDDMDGYFVNNSITRPEPVNWPFIALIIRAALSYE